MALSHLNLDIVTGAFSFTGRYVARRLLDEGVSVSTLTRNPGREGPFGGLVPASPLDFSDPDGLCRSMQGAGVLYNTYWIRFGPGRTTFEHAVENSRVLFDAAVRAGVSSAVLFQIMSGKLTPSGDGLRRLHVVLFAPSPVELVAPVELKALAWKKGGRNGVVVSGAGGPGGDSIRVGGRVPWGA